MTEEDFEIDKGGGYFDFKGFLLKMLRYWWLFALSWAIAFAISKYINVRKVPIYAMKNVVSIKDDQNPLFTGNTSLVFNWGGTTDKVQTNIVLLKSRTHAEKVVLYLQYYLSYQKQGKYHLEDVYGNTPFNLRLKDTFGQLYNKRITVTDLGNYQFEFKIPFKGGNTKIFNYHSKEIQNVPAPESEFVKIYKVGDTIDEPFLRAVIDSTAISPKEGNVYFLTLGNFNSTVKRYQGINIVQTPRGSSILELRKSGTNKARLVDYLNASVKVRIKDQLDRKNLFATKTIKFIDSSLAVGNAELNDALTELSTFKNNNLDVSLDGAAQKITERLQQYDNQKKSLEDQLTYYDRLENYLRTRTDYTDVPAPSVEGIKEGSIGIGVAKIVSLSVERSNLRYSAKENNPIFAELDRNIDAEKAVLLENIRSSKSILQDQANSVAREIYQAETELRRFPKEEQQLSEIERRFTLSQAAVNLYKSKRSEANIIKASNVSDIVFIDEAKDVGGGQIGPNNKLNNMIALILGGLIPATLVFLLVFFNTKIGNLEEVKKLSNIPVLGVIGKSNHNNSLVVRDHPRSSIAEAFRGLRSSLQFIYKKQNVVGAKTVLVTSSVSGEGKTFTSINLASVFALSEKKTVLVGLDLRKPKIFDDFEITNDFGVVNYLIGQSTLDEIKQPSGIQYLDIILSGPIPPNPSEMIISDRMKEFMDELKSTYDYVILDTPPLGLVSDAFELMPYADASLYMIRQGYTKKGMLRMITEKYKTNEIENVSFILNYFKAKGAYGYDYGYGYGYGYGAYGNGYHEKIKRKGGLLKRTLRRLKLKK